MAYEVQEYCLCGGWTNTWSYEENGKTISTTYDTEKDAEADLKDFFRQMRKAVKNKEMEDVPDAEDFRIVEIKA
jgi:predicted ribosome quality control (RQC) complex YloA/Tae2 family protein